MAWSRDQHLALLAIAYPDLSVDDVGGGVLVEGPACLLGRAEAVKRRMLGG
jgi:hypothetical protein